MGTLLFTKSSNLSPPPSGGGGGPMLLTTAGTTTTNLSQVCLKGKLDLSMWRGVGDDDDDEDYDNMESTTDARLVAPSSSPQPPLSPLLVSLLATKTPSSDGDGSAYNESYNATTSKRTFSPSSSSMLPPMVIVSEAGEREHVDVDRHANNLYHDDDDSDDGKKVEVAARVVASSSNNNKLLGTSQGYGLSTQRESQQNGFGLRQRPSVGKGVRPEHYREEQQPQIASFVSSGLDDSSQLLKSGSQSPSGRQRVKSATRKVEFTGDVGFKSGIMEGEKDKNGSQIQAKTTAASGSVEASSGGEKKRGESAKDDPATRSRSSSAARRPSSNKTKTADILQEIRKMSLASQDALEEKKKAAAEAASSSTVKGGGKKFGRKSRQKRRKEEEYTDKDRAAAVTGGSKDIKQSLKAKKKRDRKMRLSISFMSGEDYVISALLGEATYQMKVKKQPEAALLTLNKALEIQPKHKAALVARSQCYLKLGDAESALKDAEMAWDPNERETYIQGLYQYAEALFQLGEFEKALIAFHRGHRIRKDMDGFRIGIQKSQEAIRRAIGDKSATAIPNLDTVLPLIQEFESAKARLGDECREEVVLKNIAKYRLGDKQLTDGKVKSKLITRELMGQLYLDKSYLTKFVKRPEEVINQQGLAKGLREEACEALKYLESREKFWRQQNPLYSRKNFTTMLKAHAHDVAVRKESVSTEPSVAKFLQRRNSVLTAASGGGSPPPLVRQHSSQKINDHHLEEGKARLRRRSSGSEPQLYSQESIDKRYADILDKKRNGKIKPNLVKASSREKLN
ncbi:unnamed protein product [Orchesella dallaii]|uniref:Tetratricopeptide repeat protein 25 n=1 Tax=Orchesella dallaii TaxID=48710 RepID=A0ABP1R5B2_9HEXA